MVATKQLVKSVITAFLTLAAAETLAADNDQNTEKCYGVAKKGMNDCSTSKASCAGSATRDKQADAFILMPQGLCEKLVDGQLKPEKK